MDVRVLQLENQFYVLVWFEFNFKEELGLYQWKFNNSLKVFKNLKGNYIKLERILNKIQIELERVNLDLMECIIGEQCWLENVFKKIKMLVYNDGYDIIFLFNI